MESVYAEFRVAVREGSLALAVFSSPKQETGVDRETFRRVGLREPVFQQAIRVGRQEQHENWATEKFLEMFPLLFPDNYTDCRLVMAGRELQLRDRGNGMCRVHERPTELKVMAPTHNRTPNYLIPADIPCGFLIETGVMTSDGKVRASRQAKFRQINRFAELVRDAALKISAERPLEIVDFGSGKSYLTFALHHVLTHVLGREVHLVGLDRNAAVIRECQRVAQKLDLKGIEFQQGDIEHYDPAGRRIDMAVSLHACDTATDAALAQAIRWECEVILAVPCCQHELNAQIHCEALTALERHGLLKERWAALATDALRGAMLEICGYKTQILEFIDMEHTPKNVLIRAIRRAPGEFPEHLLNSRRSEYAQLKSLAGVESFALERYLGGLNSASVVRPEASP